jgi:hypothetical protein
LAIGNGTAGDVTGTLTGKTFIGSNAGGLIATVGTTAFGLFENGTGTYIYGQFGPVYCNGNTPFIGTSCAIILYPFSPAQVMMSSGTALAWSSSSTDASTTKDTNISRLGPASLAIGNGTAGDFSGTLKCATVNATSAYQANGTPGVTQTAIAVGTLATIEGIVTTFTGVSDERLKNHAPYTGGLEEILGITPIRFTYNELGQKFGGWDKEHVYVGFSAQNVQKSIPEAIQGTEGKEKYLSFDDRPVIAALCNAIKELTARITELEMSVRYLLEHCRRSVPGNRAQ